MSTSLFRNTRGLYALALAGALAACGDSTAPPARDVLAPTLELTSPAADTMVNTPAFALSGRAADSVGVARVAYQLDGGAEQQATLSGTSPATFSIAATLHAGTNTFTVAAFDAAGNRSALATRRITLDAEAPVVALATRDTTVLSATLAIRATATDPSGVRRAGFRLNGGAEQAVQVTPDAAAQLAFDVPLAEGDNTVEVAAYDAAGNRTAATLRATRRSLAGRYVLTQLDGRPLPVVFYYSEIYDTQRDYVAGDLVLNADATYVSSYVVKYTRGTLNGRVTAGSEETFRWTGTYRVSRDTIYYRYAFGAQFPGQPSEFGVKMGEGGAVRGLTHTFNTAAYRRE
jgi:hypothetical protein